LEASRAANRGETLRGAAQAVRRSGDRGLSSGDALCRSVGQPGQDISATSCALQNLLNHCEKNGIHPNAFGVLLFSCSSDSTLPSLLNPGHWAGLSGGTREMTPITGVSPMRAWS
jgi:hypothetical protein